MISTLTLAVIFKPQQIEHPWRWSIFYVSGPLLVKLSYLFRKKVNSGLFSKEEWKTLNKVAFWLDEFDEFYISGIATNTGTTQKVHQTLTSYRIL